VGITGVIIHRLYPEIAADLLEIAKEKLKSPGVIKEGVEVGIKGGRTIGLPGGF
jgi:hypothetical protein